MVCELKCSLITLCSIQMKVIKIEHGDPTPPNTHPNTHTETPSASSSEEDGSHQMVNISLFSTSPEVLHSFPCLEIKDTPDTFPRCVCICATLCISLASF